MQDFDYLSVIKLDYQLQIRGKLPHIHVATKLIVPFYQVNKLYRIDKYKTLLCNKFISKRLINIRYT